jgi:hypothetical protein
MDILTQRLFANLYSSIFNIIASDMQRFLVLLYSLAILRANLQHKIILSLLAEGIVNVAASVVTRSYLEDVIGVALGTLRGATMFNLVCFVQYYSHTSNHPFNAQSTD